MEIAYSPRGGLESRYKYISDFLDETSFTDCQPIKISIDYNGKLSMSENKLLVDIDTY